MNKLETKLFNFAGALVFAHIGRVIWNSARKRSKAHSKNHK